MPSEKPITVFEAISGRRAVRSFKPVRLDEKTIRQLLEAAVRAPTAIHLEPWAFLVLQDGAALRRISDRAKAMRPPELTQRQLHHQAVVPEATGFVALLASPEFNIFYDAGNLIAIGALEAGTFTVADCWLAAENLMLAAYGLGLGSCCIGSAVTALNAPETRGELDLPAGFTVVAPVVVGVPTEWPPATSRKPPNIVAWRRGSP